MNTAVPNPKLQYHILTAIFVISVIVNCFIFSTLSNEKIEKMMIYIIFPSFLFGASFINSFKTFSKELKKKQPLLFEQNKKKFSAKLQQPITKKSLYYSRSEFLKLKPEELVERYNLIVRSFILSISYLFVILLFSVIWR